MISLTGSFPARLVTLFNNNPQPQHNETSNSLAGTEPIAACTSRLHFRSSSHSNC